MSRRNARTYEPHRTNGLRVAKRVLLRSLLIVLLFTSASGALLFAYAAAATSPALQVKKALVSGTKYLSRFEVLSAAGIGSDSNLAALPVGLIEQRLASLKWIKSVAVQRRLPDTVEIRVVEHIPTHLALVDGSLYYLNRDMSAYTPLKLGESPPDRPVITGLNKIELVDPDIETQNLLLEASKLLNALPSQTDNEDGRLSEIHLNRIWGLSLIWEHLAATVRLGFDDYGKKLERYKKVTKDLTMRGEIERASLIDLSDERRVVVRFGG